MDTGMLSSSRKVASTSEQSSRRRHRLSPRWTQLPRFPQPQLLPERSLAGELSQGPFTFSNSGLRASFLTSICTRKARCHKAPPLRIVSQPRFATRPSKYQANKILAEFQRFAHVECRIRSNEANKKAIRATAALSPNQHKRLLTLVPMPVYTASSYWRHPHPPGGSTCQIWRQQSALRFESWMMWIVRTSHAKTH